jgi:predicted transcriptional regulator
VSEENQNDEMSNLVLVDMTTKVVSAYVGNNPVASSQITEVIHTIYGALISLSSPTDEVAIEPQKPAVSIRKSITPDYIICLEDGKQLKMLKRHLRTTYDLSPEEYRAKWGLSADYPMVAPNYAKQRSEFAKKIGLGKQNTRRNARKK